MKISRVFNCLFTISLLFTGCASTPDLPVPQWLTDSESVYPEKEYLYQLGEGVSPSEAKNNAQAELASYLNTNIQRVVETNITMVTGSDSQVEKDRSLNSSVIASTNLDIFAMETTETYYYKATKKWYCGAYINRKTAFEQREPVVRDDANKFYGVLELAEKTEDPLKKIKIYANAKKTAEPFIDDLYTLIMFSKDLTEKSFGKDRKAVASLEGLIQNEKNKCIMYVNVPVDSGKKVSSAAKKIFSESGFIITEKPSEALYTVNVDVDYNEVTEGSGDDKLYVYLPSVKVTIKGTDGFIYSFERDTDKKNMSYYKSKGEAAACDNVAALLKTELAQDLNSQLNNR